MASSFYRCEAATILPREECDDAESTYAVKDLHPYLFANNSEEDDGIPSLASQFEKCSAAKLLLEPVFGGVAHIQLNRSLDDYNAINNDAM